MLFVPSANSALQISALPMVKKYSDFYTRSGQGCLMLAAQSKPEPFGW
ncbi:MAG: hypothetical protein R3D55_01355 [Chloroflexota bacterium]